MESRQIQNASNRDVLQSVDNLEDKLRQIKFTIQDILAMLDLQEQVPFPDLIDQFASLSSDFSAIQDMMKKSCVPTRNEDNGLLMKSNLLVPNIISLEEDPKLLTETENRISSWNHEVVPNYLRTQLAPHVIEQERSLEKEAQLRQLEVVIKQIQSLNKNIDVVHGIEASRNILSSSSDRSNNMPQLQSDAALKTDLKTLVLGVMRGHGIRPKAGDMSRAKK